MSSKSYLKDWGRLFDNHILNSILKKLEGDYKNKFFCPSQNKVFEAFKLCDYKNLRIVMIGQDPYPQKGMATGILFGNSNEIPEESLSPSLKIIKEAVINFEVPHNCIIFDNSLVRWVEQGILMINSSLTVEMNNVGSHTMLWRPFMTSFLKNLGDCNTGIIYVLFGKQAQTLIPYIEDKMNFILTEYHPAYYARIEQKMPSDIFNKIDELMKLQYNESIEWFKEY